MRLRSAGVLLVALSVAASASAASFIVPTDRELVHAAKAIVIAKGVTSYSVAGPNDMIYTVFEMEAEEVIKGEVRIDQRLRLVEPGGFIGRRGILVPGAVGYRVGERALVFLDTQDDGSWRTWGMALGKFNFVQDLHGTRLLLRGQDEGAIFGWDAAGNGHQETVRSEEKFLHYVRAEACGGAGDASYTVDPSTIAWARKVKAEVNGSGFHACDYVYAGYANGHGCGAKWPNGTFDQPGGSGSAGFSLVGTQSGGVDGAAAAAAGANAWNANSLSNVNFSIGSGSNQIKFDDNTGVALCGNPAAVGCTLVGTNEQTFPFDGGTFVDIAQVIVSIKAGFTSNQALLNQIVCHELGHGLGFRHSGDSAPAAATAVMMASANAGSPFGANLQSWDTDAVQTVYNPSPGVTCTPVGVPTPTANPTTISPGGTSQLSATASGTSPAFTWFTGSPPGNTSNQVGTGASLGVSPATTTSYWVRATNACTTSPVNSAASVTVTVQCTAPTQATATANPTTVVTGATSQITVAANGSGPLTYQLMSGNPPGSAVGSSTSSPILTTPALSTTSTFYVDVSNSCGRVSSNAVTITVQACSPPTQATATANPNSLVAGTPTTLIVGSNGTGPLSYQWFTGFPPNGSPILGANTQSLQQSPGVTTTYFAQVSNACGGPINSSAVTVTVVPVCAAPSNAVATATPAAIQSGQSASLAVTASGTGLTFQWFTGTPPNGTPIPGATSATVPVSPTANTTYFARVTGQCGNIDSNAVTVTVSAACVDPSIDAQPASATILVGTSKTLTVDAGGTAPLHYQWFEGATGDTSKPRGIDSPSFNSGPLAKKTQFWVQVRGNCAGDKRAGSNTATIDVKAGKHPAVKH